MKKLMALMSVSAAVLMISACTSAPTTLPPGEYHSTNRSVNENGTAVEKDQTTKVYYDEYGNKKASQETTTSRDPKGLFNKSTSTSTKKFD
jgi:hypothetical protein